MNYKRINFDRELTRGRIAYEEKIGRWWHQQSLNRAHDYAYRKVAEFLREALPKKPDLIIDYACGAGNMLARLPRRFPSSRFLALDGSKYMLKQARQRVAHMGADALARTRFQQTPLPNFALPSGQADVVLFVFPNIVVSARQKNCRSYRLRPHKDDVSIGRYLGAAREPDPEDETVTDDPETLFDAMMDDHLVSRNLRSLLKRGGHCVRVEYSNAHRDEFTPLVQQRKAFEEGALDHPVNGRKARRFFRYLKCKYVRSKVIEDVYHQTGDKEDLEGGFSITLLKAV